MTMNITYFALNFSQIIPHWLHSMVQVFNIFYGSESILIIICLKKKIEKNFQRLDFKISKVAVMNPSDDQINFIFSHFQFEHRMEFTFVDFE